MAKSACADDTSPMSDELSPLQSLVSEAGDFSVMEVFVIQPVKSVVLPVPYHMRELNDCDIQIKVEPVCCVSDNAYGDHVASKYSRVRSSGEHKESQEDHL